MMKKVLVAIVVLLLVGAAVWRGGAFAWRTLRAMHGQR